MFEVNTVLAFIGLLVVIILTFLLLSKDSKMNSLQTAVNNLQNALDEMDEQAKLVVRTDIELNKAQEELDKKIAGLYSLQRLSRAISSTLEETQIFKMVEMSNLEDLGFQLGDQQVFLVGGKVHTVIVLHGM